MLKSWDDLEYLNDKRPIGEGAFSKVYKIKLKTDGKIYALKEINITNLSKGDRDNLKEEIKIHKNINHEFIIKFFDVMQIFNYVYILWEYCELGSLFYYINERSGMPEQIALKFFYQISEAIKFLHEKDIIHRDIKPENILITKDYKAKWCDFGWSTILDNNLKNSICGTYEYMSPEIILEKNYDYKIDSWALGILLYESLHGFPPYKASSIREIKDSIIQNDIEIKKDITKTTAKMIKKLLKLNSKNRISSKEIFFQKCYCDHRIFLKGKLQDDDLNYFKININKDFINKKEELSVLKYNKKIQSITVDDINKYIENIEENNNLNSNKNNTSFFKKNKDVDKKSNINNQNKEKSKNNYEDNYKKQIETNKKFEELKKLYNLKKKKDENKIKNKKTLEKNNCVELNKSQENKENKINKSYNYLTNNNSIDNKINKIVINNGKQYNNYYVNNLTSVYIKDDKNNVNINKLDLQNKTNKINNYPKMTSLDTPPNKDKNFNEINKYIKYNKNDDNKINNKNIIYDSNLNFKNYKNKNIILKKNNSLKDIKKIENISYKYTIIEKLNGEVIKKYQDGKEELISSRKNIK